MNTDHLDLLIAEYRAAAERVETAQVVWDTAIGDRNAAVAAIAEIVPTQRDIAEATGLTVARVRNILWQTWKTTR